MNRCNLLSKDHKEIAQLFSDIQEQIETSGLFNSTSVRVLDAQLIKKNIDEATNKLTSLRSHYDQNVQELVLQWLSRIEQIDMNHISPESVTIDNAGRLHLDGELKLFHSTYILELLTDVKTISLHRHNPVSLKNITGVQNIYQTDSDKTNFSAPALTEIRDQCSLRICNTINAPYLRKGSIKADVVENVILPVFTEGVLELFGTRLVIDSNGDQTKKNVLPTLDLPMMEKGTIRTDATSLIAPKLNGSRVELRGSSERVELNAFEQGELVIEKAKTVSCQKLSKGHVIIRSAGHIDMQDVTHFQGRFKIYDMSSDSDNRPTISAPQLEHLEAVEINLSGIPDTDISVAFPKLRSIGTNRSHIVLRKEHLSQLNEKQANGMLDIHGKLIEAVPFPGSEWSKLMPIALRHLKEKELVDTLKRAFVGHFGLRILNQASTIVQGNEVIPVLSRKEAPEDTWDYLQTGTLANSIQCTVIESHSSRDDTVYFYDMPPDANDERCFMLNISELSRPIPNYRKPITDRDIVMATVGSETYPVLRPELYLIQNWKSLNSFSSTDAVNLANLLEHMPEIDTDYFLEILGQIPDGEGIIKNLEGSAASLHGIENAVNQIQKTLQERIEQIGLTNIDVGSHNLDLLASIYFSYKTVKHVFQTDTEGIKTLYRIALNSSLNGSTIKSILKGMTQRRSHKAALMQLIKEKSQVGQAAQRKLSISMMSSICRNLKSRQVATENTTSIPDPNNVNDWLDLYDTLLAKVDDPEEIAQKIQLLGLCETIEAAQHMVTNIPMPDDVDSMV